MRMIRRTSVWVCTALTSLAACAQAAAQLRVANWNVTNYSSGRVADFQSAIYGTGPGGIRFLPDVIIAEEIIGTTATPTGANNFLALLNSFPGGPTDWARADYVQTTVNNGSNPSHALFYRTSKIDLLTQTPFVAPSTQYTRVLSAGTGSGATSPPRDNHRWRVRLKGYTSAGAEVYLYAAHYKAGTAGSDSDRRVPESERIRLDSNALPAGANFILGADLNMQESSQLEYQTLLLNGANAAGRFIDPINSPGTWENNSTFRFIHTQDPVTASPAGMDSRHDQLLISPTLRNSTGIDYMGSSTLAFSTGTWNDVNHSYRAWGNDGSSFNNTLTVGGNTMVGATIAQDLVDCADTGGHLPVFMDLRIPAVAVVSTTTINFGDVDVGSAQSRTFTVGNGINTVLWDRGGPASVAGVEKLQTLSYTLSASSGFTVPGGTFTRGAGAMASTHSVTLNTATTGPKVGTVTISSNALDAPTIVINITANVIDPAPTPCNVADITGIGGGPPDDQLTLDDILLFVDLYNDSTGCPGTPPCNQADLTQDGGTLEDPGSPDGLLTLDDILLFIDAYTEGCSP